MVCKKRSKSNKPILQRNFDQLVGQYNQATYVEELLGIKRYGIIIRAHKLVYITHLVMRVYYNLSLINLIVLQSETQEGRVAKGRKPKNKDMKIQNRSPLLNMIDHAVLG